MFQNISNLCRIDGISGRESLVAEEILRQVKEIGAEAYLDNLGNVLVQKRGAKAPKHRVMLSSHMDEVGLILTGVTEGGFLRVAPVGGIDPKVVAGRQIVVGRDRVPGVVGAKPIHLLEDSERERAVPIDKLYVDIGAKDKDSALSHVTFGDSICFIGDYTEFGDGFITAKALDDRVGCAVLLDIMKEDLPYDTCFAFTVQEELGGRGAKAAAYTIDPEISIVVETTASGDVSGAEGDERVALMGGGAVVSYMDRSTIYDSELYLLAFQTAKENSIPCQTKTKVAGGNDSGSISVSRGGVRTAAISVPCRYLHSPSDVAKKSDIQAVRDLTKALCKAVQER